MHFSFIHQSDSVYIIIMSVHHCALDIKLMIICNCQIDLSHSCKNCNQHNHASFSCIFDRLSHCNVISCTIIDNICLIRSKGFYHCFPEIFISCVDTYVNSTLFCFFQTKITDICDHNFSCSHPFCRLRYQISDRTGSYHHNIHSCYIAHLFNTMNSYCQRLNHCALFIRHIFRYRCYF